MKILDHFSGTPRPLQRQILQQLAQQWDSHDVFVLQVPVAGGKSRIADCVARWQGAAAGGTFRTDRSRSGGTAIITPNNLLTEQYQQEFPDHGYIKAKYQFDCTGIDKQPGDSCFTRHRRRRSYCKECPYAAALVEYKSADTTVSNYYTYLAHRAYRQTLIVDEAHNLLSMMTGDAAAKLWFDQWHIKPGQVPQDYSELCHLLERRQEQYPGLKARAGKLLKSIKKDPNRLVISQTVERYRGRDKPLLKIQQIDARGLPPVMFPPSKVKKIVLMSATINEHDIHDLGLDSRRVLYLQADSPIPPAVRPITHLPTIKVSHGVDTAPALARQLRQLMQIYPTRGIIHTTYNLAALLRAELHMEDRLIWHTQANKTQQFRRWQRSQDGVLVASGMYEGIDLVGDQARWQVITKVPYPDLSEPAVQHKAQQRPEWYQWAAVRDLCQASGRICRTPTDYGQTVILDKNFKMLYSKHKNLFPGWFREALR